MKVVIGFLFALFTVSAFAADVTATITLMKDGKQVYRISQEFNGMSDAEATALEASGMKTLDFASKLQNKGGSYTIVWQWNDKPAVETESMTFNAVNATLRRGHQWNGAQLDKAEKLQKAKKGRPWGN